MYVYLYTYMYVWVVHVLSVQVIAFYFKLIFVFALWHLPVNAGFICLYFT